MFVFTYTVNDPKRMKELIAIGVDGIETDVPRLLLSIRGERPRASKGPLFVVLACVFLLAVLSLARPRR
jgi:hypothetical protein